MSDFKELEERILTFWEDNDVFRKSMQQRHGRKPFVFFEGPPTANGSPGIHHVIARVFKDIVSRYKTMRGHFVLRKGGWDTHGLPVEIQVEKELGFKSKKDIEVYGIAAYNAKCRESVWKFKGEWERFTRRIAYWLDLQHPYVTYENPYIESLWNIIGRIWDKKLLYQAHRVVPFCTRCGTPLSSHEVAQGYKKITENSVYLKFKVKSSKLKLPKNSFILAWTTTPWTLPGNVALAVGRDIDYVLAKPNGTDEHYVIAADLANKVLGAPLAIENQFKGKDLVGTSYEPLFSVRALKKPKSYKVYEADFVSTTDGTGVVHTAVMYGEDDYQLGSALGLVMQHTVDEQGKFFGVSKELNGAYVKASATEAVIMEKLRSENALLKTEHVEHDYPFCWRCDTPLLYYAKDSWFIRMSAINKQLLANNESVNWVPEHLKNGRFGQWLREGKDWAFSRERYWGTPLPIWQAREKRGKGTGPTLVIKSIADLETYRARKANTYWMVRHGQGSQNISGIIDTGDGTSELTPLGRQQAASAAAVLKKKFGRKKPLLLVSPLVRTRQTADFIALALGVREKIDDRLREIKLGPTLDGCHGSKYHAAFPTYESKFTQRPPGGESLADLKARQWDLLNELEQHYEGRDIILVGHEYPMWMFQDVSQGWNMEQSIAEKKSSGDEFIDFAQVRAVKARNLPRDERGNMDLHRPYIDDIVLKLPTSSTKLYRVPEIADVWFDSGAMPYAQWHWPFENGEIFKEQFPADFISEAIDQTRGWFYTLLAVSTLLGDPAPYKNVLSLGHILDEKGQKMSKSKGNIILPEDVFNAVGIDATRWYFYTVNAPGDTKNFSLKEVRERLTGFMMTLNNCLRFYELYREQHGILQPEFSHASATNLLDKWILSRLREVTSLATARLDTYDITTAARELEKFVVVDFSQWWLRRSRKRNDSLPLLRHILRSLALLLAPFIPYTAEELWQKLKSEGDPLSVHLADWPATGDDTAVDTQLHEQMTQVREFISAGLAVRKENQIKVRQPLQSVTVSGKPLHDDLEELIKEELNVKEVKYEPGAAISLDVHIGTQLRAEGFAREVMRTVQDMRKEAGCQVADRVYCQWFSDDAELSAALAEYSDMISTETGLSAFVNQPDDKTMIVEKNFELAPGKPLWIGIRT